MQNQTVREQFNKQAEKFAAWSVGKNIGYLQSYYEFCGIQPNDEILDVACGPGDFTIFLAKKVIKTQGVDISDKEIELAKKMASEFGLKNVNFDCSDVEVLPYKNNSFSIVICKSAFHHFQFPDKVFTEMIRCCKENGKISIQDIVTYEDEYVNEYFESLDKLIDVSHNITLNEKEFNQLYESNTIKNIRKFRLSVELNMNEYLEHAAQDDKSQFQIQEQLHAGLNDNKLTEYLYLRNGEMFFKRPVYLIIGNK